MLLVLCESGERGDCLRRAEVFGVQSSLHCAHFPLHKIYTTKLIIIEKRDFVG
jgi:hypothetical protein